MKPQIVAGLALLVAPALARVTPPSEPLLDFLHLEDFNSTHADKIPDWTDPATGGTGETSWDKAVDIGRTLYFAMKSKDSIAAFFFKNYPEFAGTVQSPWDGDLREELMSWGYNDNDELSDMIKNDCDFGDKSHNIRRAFEELGLDTRAAVDGGPNRCLRVDHYNGPIVKRKDDGTFPLEPDQYYDNCGKQYRITGATFEFSMSPNGVIALMNVMSAAFSAQTNLWNKKPKSSELPHLRSTADIAWGLWNRVAAGNLQNVRYLFVTQILNPSTRSILRDAYRKLTPPKSEDEKWPGIEFSMESVEGQAILGSPVGRWAGYFLLQHKKQLGGNRFIYKVRAFKNDANSLPYLLFYIDPNPWPDNPNQKPGEEPDALPAPELPDTAPETTPESRRDVVVEDREEKGRNELESRVVKRSADGKSVIREHVLRAKL